MVQIDELQIRVPGINGEEARILGARIGQRVAIATRDIVGPHQIPELKIQLKGSVSNDTTQMADLIAEQIIMQIKLAIY